MSKRASASAAKVSPASPPGGPGTESVPVPTEAEARARLAGFRGVVGRMTQAEFDALVVVAAPAEDKMSGR